MRDDTDLEKIIEIASTSGMKINSVQDAIDLIKVDLLLSLYRNRDEKDLSDFDKTINSRIAEVWEDMYPGSKFDADILLLQKPIPYFLYGMPGQGKTAAYREATKEVACLLNLNYVERITDDYKPKQEDLILVIQESAGENSSLSYGGAPKAKTITLPSGEEKDVLVRALNYRFAMFEQTAGGVLVLDDAANASETIQNVFLPIAQDNAFQGMYLHNCLVGFTGNLGALDGTFINDQSYALKNRTSPLFILNKLEEFLDKAYKTFNDNIADVGYFGFLKRHEDVLYRLPNLSEKGGPTPRSHMAFIQKLRVEAVKSGGRENIGKILPFIKQQSQMLGREVGMLVESYYESYLSGADPMAAKFVLQGDVDVDQFNEAYKNGASGDAMTFGYQFALASGDYAISLLNEHRDKKSIPEKAFKEAVSRFGNAVLLLNDTEFNMAVAHFKNKLTYSYPSLTVPNSKKPSLRIDVKTEIAVIITALENCDISKRNSLFAIIAETDVTDSDVNQVVEAKIGKKPKIALS